MLCNILMISCNIVVVAGRGRKDIIFGSGYLLCNRDLIENYLYISKDGKTYS